MRREKRIILHFFTTYYLPYVHARAILQVSNWFCKLRVYSVLLGICWLFLNHLNHWVFDTHTHTHTHTHYHLNVPEKYD